MNKTLAAVIGTALVAGSLLVAQPAQAAISLSSVSLSTSEVILNGDSGCGNRITVTVKANIPEAENDDLFGVTGEATAADGDIEEYLFFNQTGRSGNTVTFKDTISICGYETPGKFTLHTEITYWNGSGTSSQSRNNTYYVKRPTSLTYNAAPEAAKRGSNLTHSGVLMFDPFAYGAMYGVSGQTLKIAFKKSGSSSYVAKGTVVTGSGGKYSKKIRTDADGIWRVEFPANTYRQTQYKYDYIDTK